MTRPGEDRWWVYPALVILYSPWTIQQAVRRWVRRWGL